MKVLVILVSRGRVDMLRQTTQSLRAHSSKTHDLHIVMHPIGAESIEYALGDGLCHYDDVVLQKRPNPFLHASQLPLIDFGLAKYAPDFLYLCADDYAHKPTWLDHAVAFLDGNAVVSHITLEIEPAYEWSRVLGTEEHGDVKALQRATLPGANWMMTPQSWREMRAEFVANLQSDHRVLLDHKVNHFTRNRGKILCAINEANHLGLNKSSTNNNQPITPPVDLAAYGMA